MKYRALGRTGLQISELGFGASPLGAVYGAFARQDGVAAVHAALCRARGADLAKPALQYSVSGIGFATTVTGSADPANVHRNARWIEEPIDQALPADVESCLASARDQGWINGRPENQQPGGEP